MTLSTTIKPILRRIQWQVSRARRSVVDTDRLPRDARAILVSVEGELAQTQMYAFHVYGPQIERAIGARIHQIDLSRLENLKDPKPLPHIEWIGFQARLNCPVGELLGEVALLRRLFPNAALVYFDWYAPLDLRHAQVLDPFISKYVKKQVFRDLNRYDASTAGDTNLMDYFGKRYAMAQAATPHQLPPGFERKLEIGTNFCVAPHLIDRFLAPLPEVERSIDLHARIAVCGTDWYQKMRQEARAWVQALDGVSRVCDGRVSRAQFFRELERSKICFSPFGYGEVCWRDFEAIATGALLLKPRMDHVRMEPDIFIDGQTYVALEWDGSDFEQKVRLYLADEAARRRIARNAHAMVQRYLREQPFIDTVAGLITRRSGVSRHRNPADQAPLVSPPSPR